MCFGLYGLLQYRLVWFWFPLVVSWGRVVGLTFMGGLADLFL